MLLIKYVVLLLCLNILIAFDLNTYQGDELTEIYETLISKYDDIETYQADFKQVNWWSEREITLHSKGTISFTDERFALKYSDPEGQRVVIINSSVYIIEELEKNMIITEIEYHISPIRVIEHYWDISEVFIVDDTENYVSLNLLPRDDADTKSVEVTIRRQDFLITGISYQDFSDNKVSFDFYDEQINIPVDKNAFSIPSGVDYSVIDQRSD